MCCETSTFTLLSSKECFLYFVLIVNSTASAFCTIRCVTQSFWWITKRIGELIFRLPPPAHLVGSPSFWTSSKATIHIIGPLVRCHKSSAISQSALLSPSGFPYRLDSYLQSLLNTRCARLFIVLCHDIVLKAYFMSRLTLAQNILRAIALFAVFTTCINVGLPALKP